MQKIERENFFVTMISKDGVVKFYPIAASTNDDAIQEGEKLLRELEADAVVTLSGVLIDNMHQFMMRANQHTDKFRFTDSFLRGEFSDGSKRSQIDSLAAALASQGIRAPRKACSRKPAIPPATQVAGFLAGIYELLDNVFTYCYNYTCKYKAWRFM